MTVKVLNSYENARKKEKPERGGSKHETIETKMDRRSTWMTACAGAASETATQEGAVDEESQGAIREAVAENDQAQEQPKRDKTQETERTEPLTVEPVRETLNMTHFDNCTFAAGFKPQQIHHDESNVIITLTVYDYEHFHKADIDELQAGDTLLIDGNVSLLRLTDRSLGGSRSMAVRHRGEKS